MDYLEDGVPSTTVQPRAIDEGLDPAFDPTLQDPNAPPPPGAVLEGPVTDADIADQILRDVLGTFNLNN